MSSQSLRERLFDSLPDRELEELGSKLELAGRVRGAGEGRGNIKQWAEPGIMRLMGRAVGFVAVAIKVAAAIAVGLACAPFGGEDQGHDGDAGRPALDANPGGPAEDAAATGDAGDSSVGVDPSAHGTVKCSVAGGFTPCATGQICCMDFGPTYDRCIH